MNRKAIGIAGGALIVGVAIAAVAFQQTLPDTGRFFKPLGDTTYAYAAAPDGRGGPANDCIVCHSIDRNGPMRSAPSLWGIVGAQKARSDWFAYSQPLRKKGGVWSPDELDKFLANPGGFVPGTSKTLPPIEDSARRRDIIAFLSTLH
jgi:cytochrome c